MLKKNLLLSDLVHGAPTTAESGSNMPPVYLNFSLSTARAPPLYRDLKVFSEMRGSLTGFLPSVIPRYLVRRGCCPCDWSACDVARVEIKRLS